jgi:hypothetical protein
MNASVQSASALSARWRIAIFDMNIAALGPSTLFEFLLECFYLWIVDASEHADKPDALRLLCGRRKRPRCGCAAEHRDELASPHSITSSAATSSVFGTVRPSAFAVFRLRMVSYFVGASTGRSAGLAPLRMRST